MARRHRTGAVASALAIGCLLGGATSAFAGPGYVITQRDGGGRAKLILTRSALRFDVLAPLKAGHKATPQLGFIVRYRGAHLFLLDPVTKRYQSLSLASAVKSFEKELRLAAHAQPSVKLPPK